MQKSFYGHGKLLLTSEYAVLDGSLALAVPTRQGQWLSVDHLQGPEQLTWQSLSEQGLPWLECVFDKKDFGLLKTTDEALGKALQGVLKSCRRLAPDFLTEKGSFKVRTDLEFPRMWGLGTSSTLIFTLSQWVGVSAFELLNTTFGGSGYDIACAGADGPILYQLKEGTPHWQTCTFDPPFKDRLFFVYLGKKQDSREGIQKYRQAVKSTAGLVASLSSLTHHFLNCRDILEFEKLMLTHEQLLGEHLDLPLVKDVYFSDFPGGVKSLGAWGGDFVMVTNPYPEAGKLAEYFHQRDMPTILSYSSMVINS